MGKLTFLLICVFGLCAISLAIGQENENEGTAEVSNYSVYDQCVENFSSGKVLTSSTYDKLSDRERQVLRDYFACVAAATNDISRCASLGFGDFSSCSKSFNCWQGFYIKLLSSQEVTPDMVRNCIQCGTFPGPDNCRDVAEAFIKKDPDKCSIIYKNDRKTAKLCQSIVNLEETHPLDPGGRDAIISMKAVKNFNSSECDRIKESTLRLRCKAFINASPSVCETNELKVLRDKYFCIQSGR